MKKEKSKFGFDRVIFYISEKKFDVLMKEAEEIYNEYSRPKKGQSWFLRIPDKWYTNYELIKFINKRILPNPTFKKTYKMARHVSPWT